MRCYQRVKSGVKHRVKFSLGVASPRHLHKRQPGHVSAIATRGAGGIAPTLVAGASVFHKGIDDRVWRPVVSQASIAENHQPLAVPLRHLQVMGDQDNSNAVLGQD